MSDTCPNCKTEDGIFIFFSIFAGVVVILILIIFRKATLRSEGAYKIKFKQKERTEAAIKAGTPKIIEMVEIVDKPKKFYVKPYEKFTGRPSYVKHGEEEEDIWKEIEYVWQHGEEEEEEEETDLDAILKGKAIIDIPKEWPVL